MLVGRLGVLLCSFGLRLLHQLALRRLLGDEALELPVGDGLGVGGRLQVRSEGRVHVLQDALDGARLRLAGGALFIIIIIIVVFCSSSSSCCCSSSSGSMIMIMIMIIMDGAGVQELAQERQRLRRHLGAVR